MMKLNLVAGLLCVALLSACSSQKITAGDTTATSSANTGITASEPSGNAVESASNNNVPVHKNKIETSGFQQTTKPTMVK